MFSAYVVAVFFRHVVIDDTSNQAKLILQGSVQPCLNPGHHLHGTLHEGERSSHRGLLRHVPYVDVGNRTYPARLLGYVHQKLVKDRGGFLVWKERDLVPDCSCADIHIPELTGIERGIVALDPQALGFQAGRQVGQRPGVDKLSQNGRCRFGKTAEHVDKTHAVETHARKVAVVDEVHTLQLLPVVIIPVAPYRQNLAGRLFNSDHIWT